MSCMYICMGTEALDLFSANPFVVIHADHTILNVLNVSARSLMDGHRYSF